MIGFDFYGEVLSHHNCGNTEDEDWEYAVSGAPTLFFGVPVLIWEAEMENYSV